MHKLLLLSDHPHHVEALCEVFQALQFEVMDDIRPPADARLPFYTVAVLEMQPKRMEKTIVDLRQRNVASKLLALVPLDANGMEARLARCGADDVLAFPVTCARLELTLRNLLRLHSLERAGRAAYGVKLAV